jgi:hypothetical protein
MNKNQAVLLVEYLKAALECLDSAAEVVDGIADNEQKCSLKRTMAEAMGTIIADALSPIEHLYPDLSNSEGD